MVLFTVAELIDLVIMTVAIGFIFSKIFKPKEIKTAYDPIKHLKQSSIIDDLIFGIKIAAPAVVLHELAHKFVAMYFGAQATLNAPLGMYALAIFLVLVRSPIIFFVGGYVTHTALLPFESALVSISGPMTNLGLWLLSKPLLKTHFGKKNFKEIILFGKLNMFLMIFNLIPIPGFDGFHFIVNIGKIIGF